VYKKRPPVMLKSAPIRYLSRTDKSTSPAADGRFYHTFRASVAAPKSTPAVPTYINEN